MAVETAKAAEPGAEGVARVDDWPPSRSRHYAADADTRGTHHMAGRARGIIVAVALAATALLTPGFRATANATGACCAPGTGQCVDGVDAATCVEAGGLYQGDGSTCAAGCALGACCTPGTGQCIDGLAAATCVAGGGLYQGDGSTCAAGCALGACCVPGTGQCIDGLAAATCVADGGLYQGDGSTCAAGCALGACCAPGAGQCVDFLDTASCVANGFLYQGNGSTCAQACPAPTSTPVNTAPPTATPTAKCPADTVCRVAAGVCDLVESCDESSDDCPADAKSTAECRAAAGACDIAESCDGSDVDCPADVKSSALCRPSAGECDVDDFCDGVNNECPADHFQSPTAACASDGNVCTDDHCDGAGECVHTPNTVPCDDGDACTLTDVCGNGSCIGKDFSWSGVLPPINQDGSSIFKYGRAIPVKFKLTGACAGATNLVAHIFLAKISDQIAGSEMEAESPSAADTGNTFHYDPIADQYVYVLATKPLSPGTWQIRIDLGDMVTDRTVIVSLIE